MATHSRFKVGAALFTKTGEIVGGANGENASCGLTCCAERVTLFKVPREIGEIPQRGAAATPKFVAVTLVAQYTGGPMPCGARRQLLAEYAPDATVWVADSARLKTIREFTVKNLLPSAFLFVP